VKPLLTLHSTFAIPAPYRVWCHVCGKGFASIEESQAHDKESLRLHQLANEQSREKAEKFVTKN
jgi:hypothetical protein